MNCWKTEKGSEREGGRDFDKDENSKLIFVPVSLYHFPNFFRSIS
jgi:hypothetical protein